MKYGYKRQISLSFEEAVEKIKTELAKEEFGVLTEIDVKETLKKKLNIDYEKYLILGVCNPKLALSALNAEKDIGLLMPCNVTAYEERGQVFVATMLPTVALAMAENSSLSGIAKIAEEKLKKVVDGI